MVSSDDTTLLPPGGGFRFAVGAADGPHSSVHRVWTSKNSDDIYLVCIPTRNEWKVSLHQSGEWQHSILSEVAMQYVSRNRERHLDQWKRPPPFADDWYRAYQVMIPRTELRYSTQDLNEVQFAPDPGPGYWTAVELVIAGPKQQAPLVFDEGYTLGRLALVGGGGLAVMARRFRPTVEQGRTLAEFRDRAYRDEAIVPIISESENPILGLYGVAEDGTRSVTELALSVPPRDVLAICTSTPAEGPARFEFNWHRSRDELK